MGWNYRVIKTHYKNDKFPESECDLYRIQEVYYQEDGEIFAYTEEKDGMAPMGESEEELLQDLQYMIEALKRPILNHEDLPRFREEENQ